MALILSSKPTLAASEDALTRVWERDDGGTRIEIVTDGLRSYPAALKRLNSGLRRRSGGSANNRAENSHLPFRRQEAAMRGFRSMQSLLKFVSVHASVYNHFNFGRHLVSRSIYKYRRAAALTASGLIAP